MRSGQDFEDAFLSAVLMAFPTRIEIEHEADSEKSIREEVEGLLKEWAQQILDQISGGGRKKY